MTPEPPFNMFNVPGSMFKVFKFELGTRNIELIFVKFEL